MENTLYYGDNLNIMWDYILDESRNDGGYLIVYITMSY